jgi:hypothetical protein
VAGFAPPPDTGIVPADGVNFWPALCANTTSPRTEVCARTCACAQLCVCMPAWHAPPHALTRTYTRTHARTHAHTVQARTRTRTRTYARMCTRARAHAHTHTCAQAHAHANARTHTYAHGGGRTGDPCSDQPVLQRLTGQRAVPSMHCSCSPTYRCHGWQRGSIRISAICCYAVDSCWHRVCAVWHCADCTIRKAQADPRIRLRRCSLEGAVSPRL